MGCAFLVACLERRDRIGDEARRTDVRIDVVVGEVVKGRMRDRPPRRAVALSVERHDQEKVPAGALATAASDRLSPLGYAEGALVRGNHRTPSRRGWSASARKV